MNINKELLQAQYEYLVNEYGEKDYSLEFIGILNLLESLLEEK